MKPKPMSQQRSLVEEWDGWLLAGGDEGEAGNGESEVLNSGG